MMELLLPLPVLSTIKCNYSILMSGILFQFTVIFVCFICFKKKKKNRDSAETRRLKKMIEIEKRKGRQNKKTVNVGKTQQFKVECSISPDDMAMPNTTTGRTTQRTKQATQRTKQTTTAATTRGSSLRGSTTTGTGTTRKAERTLKQEREEE